MGSGVLQCMCRSCSMWLKTFLDQLSSAGPVVLQQVPASWFCRAVHWCRAVWLQAVGNPWCLQGCRHKTCAYKWALQLSQRSKIGAISTCGRFLKAPAHTSHFAPRFPLISLKNRHPHNCTLARTVPLWVCVKPGPHCQPQRWSHQPCWSSPRIFQQC